MSRHLVGLTPRSIHLVTPFDSGGSSAVLRRALDMPAVGDLRNRVLALSDPRSDEERRVCDLLGHRLPSSGAPQDLAEELRALLDAAPPEVAHLASVCLAAVPADFDLRHASVGNLVLAGAWLEEGGRLGASVERFAGLVPVRGVVRPVTESSRHLAARMDDGSVLVGQHRITDGTWARAGRRLARLFLTDGAEHGAPSPAPACPEALALVGEADLLCYPMGSFHTSVLASLLPEGTAAAVQASGARKVYVPNPGPDAEETGLGLGDRVRILGAALGAGADGDVPLTRVLDTVLLDVSAPLDRWGATELERSGVRCVRAPLSLPGKGERYDDQSLAEALLELATAPGR